MLTKVKYNCNDNLVGRKVAVKAIHIVQKQAWWPLFFYCIFLNMNTNWMKFVKFFNTPF